MGRLWTSVNERDGLGDNLAPDYSTHVGKEASTAGPGGIWADTKIRAIPARTRN
jgi:hypothetical protein